MKKKKLLKWVFGILFVAFICWTSYISGKFTIRIMTFGLEKHTEDYNLMRGMAIILQAIPSLFTAGALLNNKINTWVRIIMLSISVFLFFGSIVANIAHIQNKSNQAMNNEIKRSSEYKQAEQTNNREQQAYQSKLDEIQNTTATYDNTIAQIEDTLSKSNAAWERNKHTTLLNEANNNKTETLKRLNNELNAITITPINTNNITMASENGYTATFKFLSQNRVINWMFKGADWELLQNYFYIMQSSIFEFIGMISLYLFSVFLGVNIKKPITNNSAPDPGPKQKIPLPIAPDTTPKLNLVKSNRPLGLKASRDFHLKKTPKNISDSDIEKYLDYMNETAVDGISQGYIKISKNIGLSQEKCRKIKAWLEQENIIKSEGGRTRIVKKSLVG